MIAAIQHTGTITPKPNLGKLEILQVSGTMAFASVISQIEFFLIDFSDYKNSMYIPLI